MQQEQHKIELIYKQGFKDTGKNEIVLIAPRLIATRGYGTQSPNAKKVPTQ